MTSPPGSGEEERDVIPPDQDAMGLVEAIQELCTEARAASVVDVRSLNETQYNLGVIRDDATRLKVLLAERETAREGLVTALDGLQQTVKGQAEDAGLWFITDDAATAYVQEGLRRLHQAIEAAAALKGAS